MIADRQTHRHSHYNTPLPYRGRNNNIVGFILATSYLYILVLFYFMSCLLLLWLSAVQDTGESCRGMTDRGMQQKC